MQRNWSVEYSQPADSKYDQEEGPGNRAFLHQARGARVGLTHSYYPTAACTSSSCRLNVGFISTTNGRASWATATLVAVAYASGPPALIAFDRDPRKRRCMLDGPGHQIR